MTSAYLAWHLQFSGFFFNKTGYKHNSLTWWLLGLVVFIHSLILWLKVALLPNPFLLYILLGKFLSTAFWIHNVRSEGVGSHEFNDGGEAPWITHSSGCHAMPCHAIWLPLWMSGRISPTTRADWLGCNVVILSAVVLRGLNLYLLSHKAKTFYSHDFNQLQLVCTYTQLPPRLLIIGKEKKLNPQDQTKPEP